MGSDDFNLLTSSCKDFVDSYIFEKIQNHTSKKRIVCCGDENIQELCNRCPYHEPNKK